MYIYVYIRMCIYIYMYVYIYRVLGNQKGGGEFLEIRNGAAVRAISNEDYSKQVYCRYEIGF